MSGMGRLRERFLRMKSCEYWRIAYRKHGGGGSILHDTPIEGFHLLPQKRFVTQADPFLYRHQGKTWLFYERQNLSDMKGTLWCVNLDDPAAKPQLALEEEFHLSYPQLFRYGKYTYMLPETRQAGEVRLYRCLQFPDKWEKVETLFAFEAVDTTLLPVTLAALEKGGIEGAEDSCRYYVFTYVENRLEIYLCDVEPDRFHITRKEKIFSSGASKLVRPGGAFVEEAGRLYRSAQNCTDYYGQELLIMEVDALESGHFEEHVHCRLSPDKLELPGVNGVGIHTYNRNGEYEVIDILHREVSLWTIFKKIGWKLRKS